MLRVLSSMEAQAISGLKNLNETVEGSLDGLVAELLVEDLADEAVERDGIEAHVRRDDHPRVDDLPLRQLLQDALEVVLRVALLAADLQILARSEEHTSELQSLAYLVCRLLLEK